MLTAYLTAMRRYATFSGRAARSEFWLFSLTTVVIVFAALVIDSAFISGPNSRARPFAGFVVLAHVLPCLAVTVRRLHDTDREGWWALINIVPFGAFVLLAFTCQPGTPGPNRFGPDPLGGTAASTETPVFGPAGHGGPPSLPAPRDVIAEIERLAQLRATGNLSDAEFEAMKVRALGRQGAA